MTNKYFANKMKNVIYTLYHIGATDKRRFEELLDNYNMILNKNNAKVNKIRILREGMNNVPFLSLLSMKYMVLY